MTYFSSFFSVTIPSRQVSKIASGNKQLKYVNCIVTLNLGILNII